MSPDPDSPLAKAAKSAYRRNLPHLQAPGKPLFVTFRTYHDWILPESVRSIVLTHCLHDNGSKINMYAVVIMPDHVHLLLACRTDASGHIFGMAEILNGIKGASAHRINKMLGRRGHVWQDESFDHILRSDEHTYDVAEYICQNPVHKGLVQDMSQWPWLWRRWVEGQQNP